MLNGYANCFGVTLSFPKSLQQPRLNAEAKHKVLKHMVR